MRFFCGILQIDIYRKFHYNYVKNRLQKGEFNVKNVYKRILIYEGGIFVMSSENGRYKGYQGYNRESSTQNTLPEPVMNMDSLLNLADFLDTSKSDSAFPEIAVIPDMLRDVGKFVNERKKMKYSHKEFEMKIKFLSDSIDKQYHIAMQKIQNETEIQLAQINRDERQGTLNINRHYDLETQKEIDQYKLKSEEMNLYYQDLEKQRKAQERQFDKTIQLAMIDREKANKAIKEVEQVCNFLSQKIYSNTATPEEKAHYMELIEFRRSGVSLMPDINRKD